MSKIRFNNKYRVPSARWVDWDYGNEGAYFVTICTKNRDCYFGEIVNAEMQYSELGLIAVHEWLKSAELRPDMQLDMDCFQVMPNHFHGIVIIGKDCRAATHGGSNENNVNPRAATHGGSKENNVNPRAATHSGVHDNNINFRTATHGGSNENNMNSRAAMHGGSTVSEMGNKFGVQTKNLASILRGFKSAVTTQARILNISFEWQTRFHDRVIRDDEEFRKIAAYIEQNPLNWENDRMNKKGTKN